MLSTKSRLLTRLAGAKNRVSMRFCRTVAARRRNERTQQQADEEVGLLFLIGGKGQRENVFRRLERSFQQAGEGDFRNADLIGGDGKAAFHDVEDPLCGAAVARGLCRMPCGTRYDFR